MKKIQTPSELKQQLRALRNDMEQNHATRLHRAISWLLSAEKYKSDHDIAFINLWISFNACYCTDDKDQPLSERTSFQRFIKRLCELDSNNTIYDLLWHNYAGFIRSVVNNQFLYSPFWSEQTANNDWETPFNRSKKAAFNALADNSVDTLLCIVLDRLYVLRNQIIHGGATYNSKVNREQVTSSHRLLAELMPVIISIMINNDDDWGVIPFPVINSH